MTYYLFSPKLDSQGKQEVRKAKFGEFYTDYLGECFVNISPESLCEYPILTMKKFDSDPMVKIREVYESFKNKMQEPIDEHKSYNLMWLFWEAISEMMEMVEGK